MSKEIRQLKSNEVKSLRKYLLKKQKGKCLICKKKTDDAVLDHHHKKRIKGTGQIRGVLCRTCNVLLAKSENNCVRYGVSHEELPEILISMSAYLKRKQLPYIHPSEAPKKPILTKSSYNKLVKVVNGEKKIPEYRMHKTKKNKPVQGLTKPLEKLFNQFNIKPEFYK